MPSLLVIAALALAAQAEPVPQVEEPEQPPAIEQPEPAPKVGVAGENPLSSAAR